MRILILGGDGMLGHRLLLELAARHEVRVTLRRELRAYEAHGIFTRANAYDGVDVRSFERLREVLAEFQPEAVVNAIGIVKQLPMAKEAIPSIEINALLPHRLAQAAGAIGARLVHFSTDCVFSGRAGNYSEADMPDAEDLYGRSKLLGEVDYPHCLTLRTSLIGHELDRKTSLIEWFLAQTGPIRGFGKVVFNGFTTIEMARIVEMLLADHREAHGVWHVSSEPIDKCSLLELVKKHYGMATEIVRDDELRCDRSLDSARFRRRFEYRPPSWDTMIAQMHGLQRI